MATNDGAETDMNNRPSTERASFGRLQAILTNSHISTSTRLRIFNSFVKSTLFSKSETGLILNTIAHKLQVVISR